MNNHNRQLLAAIAAAGMAAAAQAQTLPSVQPSVDTVKTPKGPPVLDTPTTSPDLDLLLREAKDTMDKATWDGKYKKLVETRQKEWQWRFEQHGRLDKKQRAQLRQDYKGIAEDVCEPDDDC